MPGLIPLANRPERTVLEGFLRSRFCRETGECGTVAALVKTLRIEEQQ